MLNYFSRLLCRFPNFKTIPTAFLDSLSYEDQVQYLSAAILDLSEKIDKASVPQSLLDDVNTLKNSVNTLSERINSVSEKVDTQGSQIGLMNNKIVALEARVAALEQRLDDLSPSTVHTTEASAISASPDLTEVNIPAVETDTFSPIDL